MLPLGPNGYGEYLQPWPQQTWTTVGVSPEAALLAVIDRWRVGHVRGLELGG